MAIYNIPGMVRSDGIIASKLVVDGSAQITGAIEVDGTASILGDASGDAVGFYGAATTKYATRLNDPTSSGATEMNACIIEIYDILEAMGISPGT